MRNGVFPAISVSKDVIVISDSSPPNVNFLALRAPGMENNTCHLAATRLQPLPMVNSGCEEMWDTGPRQLRCIWKEWLQWAQTLASSHTKKLRSWNSNTLATWCKELTHWKRPWCWERLKAGGEGDNRVWHGWTASPTRWTWVSAISGSWWWTGNPGALQSIGMQGVRLDWATELDS